MSILRMLMNMPATIQPARKERVTRLELTDKDNEHGTHCTCDTYGSIVILILSIGNMQVVVINSL